MPYGSGGPPVPNHPRRVENNLVWAILSTLLCCWPLGIAGIVQAVKVDRLVDRGDYVGAQHAATRARTWSIRSAAAMVLFYGFMFAIAAATGGLDSSGRY